MQNNFQTKNLKSTFSNDLQFVRILIPNILWEGKYTIKKKQVDYNLITRTQFYLFKEYTSEEFKSFLTLLKMSNIEICTD